MFKTLKTRWNSRLSRQLAFWVFMGIITIESIILVPSVQRREQELLDQIKEITLGKVTWILITYPNLSGSKLMTHLQDLEQSHALILGGAVYQSSGEKVGNFGNFPEASWNELASRRSQRQGSFYDDVIWLGSSMKTDYTITLRHDASSVQSELMAYIARISGLVIIISLFLTLTVWIALDPIVITPIFRLRRDLLTAGNAICQDQIPPEFYSASVRRQDELGDVVTAFQTMFRQITEAIDARKKAEAELQNSLKREAAYAKALDQELEKGRLMQQNFLPREIIQKPGYELAAFMSPARRVAGDFYDVFELPCNNLGVVIGDVCDKGVSAGLFMGLFRSLIRIFSGQTSLSEIQCLDANFLNQVPSESSEIKSIQSLHPQILQAVQLTNDYIAQNHGDEGMFATLFFGVLHPETGLLTYINGGHEPLILLTSQGRIRATLEPTGTAVGMLPDMTFEIQSIWLNSGEILFGCTDGVTEARNSDREFFGREKFLEILQRPFDSAEQAVETVKSDVLAHIGTAEQSDDITLFAVKRA
ncbi:MAG: PP2C family protein-serine/threonine phosphatase [Oscillatoriales cyanobacterium RM2_1_1]|nr:PP2C family protein-serine/threonine phosphatase [Oscillatoriales cyanobacterium SM2_3_0]NJO47865.1 PP2C family protein-serine/threonine phosphatase [Oscillatoriales cyanobacterium RM2_1_1]